MMKSRGMGYAELAERIGLSESGIKKIFLGNDCSFSRLSSICAALDISLPDLIHAIESKDPEEIQMSEQAEAFFCENFDYFQFYWKLAYERRTVDEVRAQLRLDEKEIFKYLRKLDLLGLVELHAGMKIRVPQIRFAYLRKSKLMDRIKKEWGRKVVEDALAPQSKGSSFFSVYYMKLSQKRRQELEQEIRKLVQEYTRHTVRSLNTRDTAASEFRMISCITPGPFVTKLR